MGVRLAGRTAKTITRLSISTEVRKIIVPISIGRNVSVVILGKVTCNPPNFVWIKHSIMRVSKSDSMDQWIQKRRTKM